MWKSTRITAVLAGLFTLFSVGEIVRATQPEDLRPKRLADPSEYLADIRSELRKAWPHNRRIVVVCHGHSVPTGYFRTPEVRPFDSYPHLMHIQLQKLYPTSVTSVICTGIGGENSEQGAIRFASDVLAMKPDLITIDYSLNDRDIGLERARIAWTKMIELAIAARVKVLLLTPTADTNANRTDIDDTLVHHAQQVCDLAAEYGVGLVDSFAAFQKYESEGRPLQEVMSHPNHPNKAGHQLVVTELIKWFESR